MPDHAVTSCNNRSNFYEFAAIAFSTHDGVSRCTLTRNVKSCNICFLKLSFGCLRLISAFVFEFYFNFQTVEIPNVNFLV